MHCVGAFSVIKVNVSQKSKAPFKLILANPTSWENTNSQTNLLRFSLAYFVKFYSLKVDGTRLPVFHRFALPTLNTKAGEKVSENL